jgi:8-oxo-dGTP diphosphatase
MFNIRVYGILINPEKQILVSDEFIRGNYYTKFPGGGLELGEGTRDCLKRVFKEEMDLNVEVNDHIYTTDYFQLSAFNPNDQIISIYYFVTPQESISFSLTHSKFDFTEQQLDVYKEKSEIETFRFVDLSDFSEDEVTLPIDKIVAKIVKSDFVD